MEAGVDLGRPYAEAALLRYAAMAEPQVEETLRSDRTKLLLGREALHAQPMVCGCLSLAGLLHPGARVAELAFT